MYALREAIAGFRRAPVLTGLSAGVIGMALFFIGLFGLATYNLRLALSAVEERVEVVVYLRDDARQSEVEVAQRELGELREVRQATYVSKRDALIRAREDLPEFGELFTDVGVNPLPQSLELELRPEARNETSIEAVAARAQSYPFVEEVRYGREWVDKIFTLRRVGAATTAVLGASFLIVAALIIGTAIRIAIHARRDEIYVMRLLGARSSFIGRPFLLEGAIAGLLGGLLAWAMTYTVYRVVYGYLFPVAWIPGSWVAGGVVVGGLFGSLASWLAVRRHMRRV